MALTTPVTPNLPNESSGGVQVQHHSGLRKNGKPQSCEPCRKSKLACDHAIPCGRCARLQRSAQCIYDPSPTTIAPASKRRKVSSSGYNSTKATDTHLSNFLPANNGRFISGIIRAICESLTDLAFHPYSLINQVKSRERTSTFILDR